MHVLGGNVEKQSVISVVVDGIHPYDMASFLNKYGIAVRSGNHCAQPMLRRLGYDSVIRFSPAFYNTKEEIEVIAQAHFVVQIICCYLIHSRRTGTHQTHITAQNIVKLRQFIDTQTSDNISDALARSFFAADNTRIIIHFKHITLHLVLSHQFFFSLLCIHIHGTEFIHFETAAILADTLLAIENRSR